MELVNWNPHTKEFAGGIGGNNRRTPEGIFKLINSPRPFEIEDLIRALDEFWAACGVFKICSQCFKGCTGRKEDKYQSTWQPRDFSYAAPNNKNKGGCCSYCPLLTDTGCASKPLSCAAYVCPEIEKKLHKMGINFLGMGIYGSGCYTEGREFESGLKLRDEAKEKYTELAARLRNLAEGIRTRKKIRGKALTKAQYEQAAKYANSQSV